MKFETVKGVARPVRDRDLDAARPAAPHHAARRLDLRRFGIHTRAIVATGAKLTPASPFR